MTAYQKYKNRIEGFLQRPGGKRFINFVYSIGAAIVILGAMFKLLHFHFGNEMLFIGMVTECLVFILSAFDTPIRDYRWEEVFPVLDSHRPEDRPDLRQGISGAEHTTPYGGTPAVETPASHTAQQPVFQDTEPPLHTVFPMVGAEEQQPQRETPEKPYATGQQETYRPFMNGNRADNLSAQNDEYGRQLESLNRKLAGLNSIYEIQLKSIGSQIDTIEQINKGLSFLKTVYNDAIPDGSVIKRETEKMAGQLRELNIVYARMLEAMTVNRGETENREQTKNREQSGNREQAGNRGQSENRGQNGNREWSLNREQNVNREQSVNWRQNLNREQNGNRERDWREELNGNRERNGEQSRV